MTYSLLGKESGNHLDQPLFLGDTVGIARFDKVRYPQLLKLTKRGHSYNWIPDEVDLKRDASDFKKLDDAGQHIFVSNLRHQILSDTFAARGPSITLLPLVSNPELETWIQTWAFFETVHSRSYTHILQTVFPTNPGSILDGILDVPEIVSSVKDTSDVFDRLYEYGALYNLFGEGELVTKTYKNGGVQRVEHQISAYELKKLIYLAFVQMNILEGVRFYVSFACSWAFAEQKKMMEGNAKVLKFICRDENLHLAGTQHVLKILSQDPDYSQIIEETEAEVRSMFDASRDQERSWVKYLLSHGTMLGLSEEMLFLFVDHRIYKCLSMLGYNTSAYKHVASDPMPWTKKWIAGGEVQVAPQETEVTSYRIGAINQNLSDDDFRDFKLQ